MNSSKLSLLEKHLTDSKASTHLVKKIELLVSGLEYYKANRFDFQAPPRGQMDEDDLRNLIIHGFFTLLEDGNFNPEDYLPRDRLLDLLLDSLNSRQDVVNAIIYSYLINADVLRKIATQVHRFLCISPEVFPKAYEIENLTIDCKAKRQKLAHQLAQHYLDLTNFNVNAASCSEIFHFLDLCYANGLFNIETAWGENSLLPFAINKILDQLDLLNLLNNSELRSQILIGISKIGNLPFEKIAKFLNWYFKQYNPQITPEVTGLLNSLAGAVFRKEIIITDWSHYSGLQKPLREELYKLHLNQFEITKALAFVADDPINNPTADERSASIFSRPDPNSYEYTNAPANLLFNQIVKLSNTAYEGTHTLDRLAKLIDSKYSAQDYTPHPQVRPLLQTLMGLLANNFPESIGMSPTQFFQILSHVNIGMRDIQLVIFSYLVNQEALNKFIFHANKYLFHLHGNFVSYENNNDQRPIVAMKLSQHQVVGLQDQSTKIEDILKFLESCYAKNIFFRAPTLRIENEIKEVIYKIATAIFNKKFSLQSQQYPTLFSYLREGLADKHLEHFYIKPALDFLLSYYPVPPDHKLVGKVTETLKKDRNLDNKVRFIEWHFKQDNYIPTQNIIFLVNDLVAAVSDKDYKVDYTHKAFFKFLENRIAEHQCHKFELSKAVNFLSRHFAHRFYAEENNYIPRLIDKVADDLFNVYGQNINEALNTLIKNYSNPNQSACANLHRLIFKKLLSKYTTQPKYDARLLWPHLPKDVPLCEFSANEVIYEGVSYKDQKSGEVDVYQSDDGKKIKIQRHTNAQPELACVIANAAKVCKKIHNVGGFGISSTDLNSFILVTPNFEGISLTKINNLRGIQDVIPLEHFVNAIGEIVRMHKLGYVHGNIHPDNVVILKDSAKITDFSWTKQKGEPTHEFANDSKKQMAPELGKGIAADPLQDVYRTLALLYPFSDKNLSVLVQHFKAAATYDSTSRPNMERIFNVFQGALALLKNQTFDSYQKQLKFLILTAHIYPLLDHQISILLGILELFVKPENLNNKHHLDLINQIIIEINLKLVAKDKNSGRNWADKYESRFHSILEKFNCNQKALEESSKRLSTNSTKVIIGRDSETQFDKIMTNYYNQPRLSASAGQKEMIADCKKRLADLAPKKDMATSRHNNLYRPKVGLHLLNLYCEQGDADQKEMEGIADMIFNVISKKDTVQNDTKDLSELHQSILPGHHLTMADLKTNVATESSQISELKDFVDTNLSDVKALTGKGRITLSNIQSSSSLTAQSTANKIGAVPTIKEHLFNKFIKLNVNVSDNLNLMDFVSAKARNYLLTHIARKINENPKIDLRFAAKFLSYYVTKVSLSNHCDAVKNLKHPKLNRMYAQLVHRAHYGSAEYPLLFTRNKVKPASVVNTLDKPVLQRSKSSP